LKARDILRYCSKSVGQRGGLHQAHAAADAEIARRVGGGGDDAAPGIAGQRGEAAGAVGQQRGLVAAAAADDHRLALELRVAQQFHRGIEGVHVQVGDPAARRGSRHRGRA
jgi:hypothetical protein